MTNITPDPQAPPEPIGGRSAAPAPAMVLPPEIEKALFIRFWTWLGIVAGILFTIGGVTAGAIGFWITSHLTSVSDKATITAATAANAAVDAKASAITSRIDEVLARSKELHTQSFSLATELGRSTGVSTEHLRAIKTNLDESTQLITSLRAAAALSAERNAGLNQNEVVAALSKSPDFARLAATGLGGLLQSAVLPFDSPSCPEGWQPFSDGAGRFLVGSSSQRPFRSSGGADSVVLSPANLPEHSHGTLIGVLQGASPFGHSTVPNPQAIHGARQAPAFVANTQSTGSPSPSPITIVPPYFALTLCRKT